MDPGPWCYVVNISALTPDVAGANPAGSTLEMNHAIISCVITNNSRQRGFLVFINPMLPHSEVPTRAEHFDAGVHSAGGVMPLHLWYRT